VIVSLPAIDWPSRRWTNGVRWRITDEFPIQKSIVDKQNRKGVKIKWIKKLDVRVQVDKSLILETNGVSVVPDIDDNNVRTPMELEEAIPTSSDTQTGSRREMKKKSRIQFILRNPAR